MYNRYIPQSDGTYTRCAMEDHVPKAPRQPPLAPPENIQQQEIPPKKQDIPNSTTPCKMPRRATNPYVPRNKQNGQTSLSLSTFLKQLLPKDFDTSDLMILLLLLIMSGDCAEDQNTALLTLVLYLFL